ncbi:MAG: cohesin domain-containing protein [Oscillospiraceae bacterium]|nr:cohesin domain-containing protein [Oscillospiraceae bacterium]
MKKIVSVLLAAVFLCGIFTFPCFADDIIDYRGTMTVSSASGAPGETVTLAISIDKNPGIIATRFFVDYNASKLQLIDAEYSDLFSYGYARYSTFDIKPFIMLWAGSGSAEDFTNTGVFAVLTFKILEQAEIGSTGVTIQLDQMSTFNRDYIFIPFTMVNGTVTINESPPEENTNKVLFINRDKTLSLSNELPGDVKVVRWESGNTNAATVNQNGVVNGNKLGKATITATTSDGQKFSWEVKVELTWWQVILLMLGIGLFFLPFWVA